jgi:hypothetical protein
MNYIYKKQQINYIGMRSIAFFLAVHKKWNLRLLKKVRIIFISVIII